MPSRKVKIVIGAIAGIALFLFAFSFLSPRHAEISPADGGSVDDPQKADNIKNVSFAELLATAKNARGIYVTGWSVLSDGKFSEIEGFLRDNLVNALVIDVKDADSFLNEKMEQRVRYIKANYPEIWLIARIVAFKDSVYAAMHPEDAVRLKNGELFADALHQNWIDPAAREFWKYEAMFARRAIDLGFDEINFDYIRFPSLASYDTLRFPYYSTSTPKHAVLIEFFDYLTENLRSYNPSIVISADVFGQTFLQETEENIGQRIADIAHYFDIVAPMIYPSHYAPYNFGIKNPAERPYEVVYQTLEKGISILQNAFAASSTATGTAQEFTEKSFVVRPWYQAFDIGAMYSPEMIKKQIAAGEAFGINGFILWNAANVYSRQVFE